MNHKQQVVTRLVVDIPDRIRGAKAPQEALELIYDLIESYGYKVVPVHVDLVQDVQEFENIIDGLIQVVATAKDINGNDVPVSIHTDVDANAILHELQSSGWIITPPQR